MKKTTIFRLARGLFVLPVALFLLALTPQPAQARNAGDPASNEQFSREELAQMLGPIALYPDKLLSQILMASTYPLEVIEADRWVKKNQKLSGDALDRALLDQEWDPSVKEISHFPAILALMSERITETTNLGNAFLAQEGEVMDMVQELRAKARAQGNLTSTPEQKVIVEKETIVIEPTNPRVIYVPYYDPYTIYGPWWYPAYPPYYWGPAGIRLGIGISFWPGIYFGFSWGNWGYFDWPHRYLYIHTYDRPRYVRHDHWYSSPGRWAHSPVHRRGVAYRDHSTATRYGGQYPQRHRDSRDGDWRNDVRGFPERSAPDLRGRRSGGERPEAAPNRHEYGGSRDERRQRVLQPRQPSGRDRQLQPGVERDRPRQERSDLERQTPATVERAPRERSRIEPERPRVKPERPRFEQQRPQIEPQRPRFEPQRPRIEPQRPRIEPQRPRFEPQRQSGDSGRSNREDRGKPSRDRGQQRGESGSGRDGGGRDRR
ncbi:MAG: DUF3300 domain-containing protein [Desulfuromonadales bacterium]|nr:DUF3300 domain-containing protein [Desulfuromonadales bacterium]